MFFVTVTIHCFLYNDSVGGVGPNEVIFLLNNLLEKWKHNMTDLFSYMLNNNSDISSFQKMANTWR